MTDNQIAVTSTMIMAGAAAACGPAGIPAFILAASIGAVLANYGGKEDGGELISIEDIARTTKAIIVEQTAREAWAKIKPSYESYTDYVGRAASGEKFSDRDIQFIDNAIFAAIGPNSDLKQGLTLLYDRDNTPNQYSYVEHCLPIFILGTGILIQYRLLDIARQKFNGELIVPYQWDSLSKTVRYYKDSIEGISRSVSTNTIESILRQELSDGKFKLGSRELQDRNNELIEMYLGGDDAVTNVLKSMNQLENR